MSASGSGLVVAGVGLPGGMDAAAQAAAQMAENAARNGRYGPTVTPPRAPLPVPDPRQVPPGPKPDPWWVRLWGMLDLSDTEFFVPIFTVNPCLIDPNISCEPGRNP